MAFRKRYSSRRSFRGRGRARRRIGRRTGRIKRLRRSPGKCGYRL